MAEPKKTAKKAVKPEAPKSVDPAPVEQSPDEAPNTHTVFDTEYEVTPERGYRQK